ncbi:MAG TPA: cupin domain-containing protein [Thermoanaerobaculia bacterium]|nr:cupin domain-containing protein [Thermoanaerobaculia bacterium]
MIERARELIALHDLQPHPEGGWYRQLFKSSERVLRLADGADRSALTTIYFLLVAGTESAPHVVKSDEVWHWYEGDALALIAGDERVLLDADHRVHVVPANVWQSAKPLGRYAFVGCTVGPGFEFDDFAMR